MSNDAYSADKKVPMEAKMERDGQPKRLPISFWVALGLFSLVPVTRSLLFETDHQFANLGGAAVTLLGCIASFVCIWRIFANTFLRRMLMLASPVTLAAIGYCLFEYVGVTGETVPVFRSRFGFNQKSNIPASPSNSVKTDRNVEPESVSISKPIESNQFLGSDRNGIVQDDRFSTAWDAQLPSILWKIPIGAGWSSFAVRDGLAITLEQIDAQECLTAFELETGKVVWRHKTQGRHSHPLGGLGPRSTPTIHRDLAFSQSALGIVSCVKLRTGELVWQQDLLKLAGISQEISEKGVLWGRSGSPLVFDNQVVVPFGGKASDGPLKSLISFDLETGKQLWSGGDQQISYSSPALLTLNGVRQIVTVNEGSVTGHDVRNGEVMWSAPWPSRSNGEACSSQPVAVDGRRLLLGKGYAQGSKLIEVSHSGTNPEAESDPAFWKVNTVWESNKALKTKFTSAIAYEGLLYGLSDGVLECVDPKDGTRVWRGKRYGHGQAIIVNGHLLILAEDGRLAIVLATGSSQGKAIAELPALDGITWNVPVVAGPYVLVRNAEFAACLVSRKSEGHDAGSKFQ